MTHAAKSICLNLSLACLTVAIGCDGGKSHDSRIAETGIKADDHAAVASHSGTVSGTVTDAGDSTKRISGATVTIATTRTSSTSDLTNAAGQYSVANVSAGLVSIDFTHPGYLSPPVRQEDLQPGGAVVADGELMLDTSNRLYYQKVGETFAVQAKAAGSSGYDTQWTRLQQYGVSPPRMAVICQAMNRADANFGEVKAMRGYLSVNPDVLERAYSAFQKSARTPTPQSMPKPNQLEGIPREIVSDVAAHVLIHAKQEHANYPQFLQHFQDAWGKDLAHTVKIRTEQKRPTSTNK